jgi:hypothetical protein
MIAVIRKSGAAPIMDQCDATRPPEARSASLTRSARPTRPPLAEALAVAFLTGPQPVQSLAFSPRRVVLRGLCGTEAACGQSVGIR